MDHLDGSPSGNPVAIPGDEAGYLPYVAAALRAELVGGHLIGALIYLAATARAPSG